MSNLFLILSNQGFYPYSFRTSHPWKSQGAESIVIKQMLSHEIDNAGRVNHKFVHLPILLLEKKIESLIARYKIFYRATYEYNGVILSLESHQINL